MPKPNIAILLGAMKNKDKSKDEIESTPEIKAEALLEAVKGDDGKKLMQILINLIKANSK